MAEHLKRALELIELFEQQESIRETDAMALLVEVFRACGHTVSDQGFIGGDRGVDCFVETNVAGKRQRIAVELKCLPRPAGVESVHQALTLGATEFFDRSMVVSRSGFTPQAVRLAETEALGKVDLFAPGDLRNWLAKFDQLNLREPRSAVIIRYAMAALAKLVAEHPEELRQIEWRDLERLLGVAFTGLGFDVTVTRPGKDGGFDLELRNSEGPDLGVYLVEVKHWSDQRPGSKHLRKLIKVTASRKATGSLLLSTSGFTTTIYSGLAELTAPVRLGGGDKVIALCKAYCRLQSGLWVDALEPEATLFAGTAPLGQHLQ